MAQAQAIAHATLVLRLGYRGAAFHGFAEQEGQRTVAGELRRALETFLRRPVELTCAGRTDAGVHAQAQYVSLPVSARERRELSARRIAAALQALTPQDIAIQEVFAAQSGFSARFDAKTRGYTYRLVDGAPPTLLWDVVWWRRNFLDVAAMNEAAQALLGEQDFVSFCKVSSAEGKPTWREVRQASVSRGKELGEPVIAFRIEASSFLHTMVRTIAGSLVLIGAGKRPTEWLGEVIAAKSRRAAGPTAPACGLTLSHVAYPEGALQPWDKPASDVSARESPKALGMSASKNDSEAKASRSAYATSPTGGGDAS